MAASTVKTRIAIVGATGYTAGELLRLALVHPTFEVVCVTSRSEAGRPISEVWSALEGQLDLAFSAPDADGLAACDLVFFATPNGVAMTMAPDLIERGARVVDLSADFRLKSAATWEQWYGQRHACPELLSDAVYGLPELNRAAIKDARLVANPGCYPTAVALGLLPLVEKGTLDPSDLIVDAKSGVSGAGRNAVVGTLFGEIDENFKAYGLNGHRHHPEIVQTLSAAGAGDLDLVFVPHLVPMFRGIHATMYCKLSVSMSDADLQALYTGRYADHPFVRVLPASTHPETRSVRGTNLCKLTVHPLSGSSRVIVLSVIDNLTKGAAGQAIQNANLMLGLDEMAGLDTPPFAP
jgi:N-acetyl-gamma-glutamyl-phosphate reductase